MSESTSASQYEQLQQELQALKKRMDHRPRWRLHRFGVGALWALVAIILALTVCAVVLRVNFLREDIIHENVGNAEIVLERAEDAVRSAEMLLAFLEVVSVLLTIALGAAAFMGFRQSGQIREEFRQELERLQTLHNQIAPYHPLLQNLDTLRHDLDVSIDKLKNMIDQTGRLLQTDQEFRLGNHYSAYQFVQTVLADSPDNQLALYIAGWLETHHIEGATEAGLEHLKRLVEISPDWPSAQAAYGVAVRRQGKNLAFAEGVLRNALAANPNLVDFNRESFWGPVAGIQRDWGQIDAAIASYEKALRVTPGSSYPQGNLAGLYLKKAQNDATQENKALDAFDKTIQYADIELGIKPNDYFLIMDKAMAATILGQQNAGSLERATEWLELALTMETSSELLKVSRRGWTLLLGSIPPRSGWEAVREAIEQAIARLDAGIAKLTESR